MTSRTYLYEPGATRYYRVPTKDDPAKYRPPPGWTAKPIEFDYHPISFEQLQAPAWFVRETYVGDPA